MQKANTSDAKFWAGGAREFHNPEKKDKSGYGFFAYLYRLFPFLNPNEVDQRLFLKKQKKDKK